MFVSVCASPGLPRRQWCCLLCTCSSVPGLGLGMGHVEMNPQQLCSQRHATRLSGIITSQRDKGEGTSQGWGRGLSPRCRRQVGPLTQHSDQVASLPDTLQGLTLVLGVGTKLLLMAPEAPRVCLAHSPASVLHALPSFSGPKHMVLSVSQVSVPPSLHPAQGVCTSCSIIWNTFTTSVHLLHTSSSELCLFSLFGKNPLPCFR